MNLIFQTFNYFPMYAPGNHLLIIKYYIDKMMDKILLKCSNHFQILFDLLVHELSPLSGECDIALGCS